MQDGEKLLMNYSPKAAYGGVNPDTDPDMSGVSVSPPAVEQGGSLIHGLMN